MSFGGEYMTMDGLQNHVTNLVDFSATAET